jgi:hypothetical protein
LKDGDQLVDVASFGVVTICVELSGGVDVEELEALQHSTFHKFCNFSLMYSQGY